MTTQLPEFTFQRYLAAKRTVDARALNRSVWDTLHQAIAAHPAHPFTVLEIGGGIGTMVQRLVAYDQLPPTVYHLVDERTDNIDFAAHYLTAAGAVRVTPPAELSPQPLTSLRVISPRGVAHSVHLYAADFAPFVAQAAWISAVDLVIAHAFLDLFDIPTTLPPLITPLRPGTLVYFTINFDGATIFEPAIDPAFDNLVETLYHRTMDARITHGKPSGDSRAGRHLFHLLQKTGIQVLDAGSSDWVVFPHGGRYPADEAYFLHFIVHTVQGALTGHPELDPDRFAAWIAQRHRQIEDGTLVYIAHQLDYAGTKSGSASTVTSRPSR